MDKLRTQFDGDIDLAGMYGQHTAANPIARFEHKHANAGSRQHSRGRKTCTSCPDDQNVWSEGCHSQLG